tara:strand:+ start:952 stop:1128 length:177 start_codon:yes stop_codon:yes gene_type:complete
MLTIFGSYPSVYTLPGTWEAQPDIVYNPSFLMIGASLVFAATGVAILLSTRTRKRKRI